MELKKYALTNDNTIITDIRHCSYDDKKYEYAQSRSKEGVVFMRDLMVSQVKKTSDNIIDLVEVGDLVGYIFWGEEYEHIEKKIDTQHIEYELKYNDIRYKITSIYKRQPNGDYKRYEV